MLSFVNNGSNPKNSVILSYNYQWKWATVDFSNRVGCGLVWFGLTINLINGLNFLFPYVPSLGGKLYDLGQVFTERPWSAIGWSPIAVFPFGVGLSFFIPLDSSFSCWVFWLIWRLERITGAMMGWKTLPLSLIHI